jgi:hypothetical protein
MMQHMGVAGLHDPILAAAGEGLVSFVFSCQVCTSKELFAAIVMMLLRMRSSSLAIRFREKMLIRALEQELQPRNLFKSNICSGSSSKNNNTNMNRCSSSTFL